MQVHVGRRTIEAGSVQGREGSAMQCKIGEAGFMECNTVLGQCNNFAIYLYAVSTMQDRRGWRTTCSNLCKAGKAKQGNAMQCRTIQVWAWQYLATNGRLCNDLQYLATSARQFKAGQGKSGQGSAAAQLQRQLILPRSAGLWADMSTSSSSPPSSSSSPQSSSPPPSSSSLGICRPSAGRLGLYRAKT